MIDSFPFRGRQVLAETPFLDVTPVLCFAYRLLAFSVITQNGALRCDEVVGVSHNVHDFFECLIFPQVQILYHGFVLVPFRFSCSLIERHSE